MDPFLLLVAALALIAFAAGSWWSYEAGKEQGRYEERVRLRLGELR